MPFQELSIYIKMSIWHVFSGNSDLLGEIDAVELWMSKGWVDVLTRLVCRVSLPSCDGGCVQTWSQLHEFQQLAPSFDNELAPTHPIELA